MKKPNLKSIKNLKRVLYKGKTTKFKQFTVLMLVIGLITSLLYFCRYTYLEYAVSRADIVLTYPEIAQSKRPDGSRFTYYQFISDENLADALELMQKEGMYEYFTVEDLRNQFYLYSYLDGSAGASVSSARSEGNDFSYVANEFKITFIQPHDYKNKNIFKKFFTPDFSSDFLNALIAVNRVRIAEEAGGIDAFKNLSSVIDDGNYDYDEKLRIYKTKINTIISYLEYLNDKEPGFKSVSHNMKIKDLEGKYDFLITDKLDGIANFIESSGISKDIEMASNKLKVNIENNQVKYNKFFDTAKINTFAMTNYDHTFTENLINVIQNEEYGLYQARPKTAFDTVVKQKHEAEENLADYGAKINEFREDLARYENVEKTKDENARLTKKCETLIKDFEDAYIKLSKTACEVVTEYHNEVNEEYITSKVTKKNVLSKTLLIKMGIVFLLGAVMTFVVAVLVTSVKDSAKINRKKKQIIEIKKSEKEKGEQ